MEEDRLLCAKGMARQSVTWRSIKRRCYGHRDRGDTNACDGNEVRREASGTASESEEHLNRSWQNGWVSTGLTKKSQQYGKKELYGQRHGCGKVDEALKWSSVARVRTA